ncbi:MAG: glycosyltransferase family 2 protein [Flavobacteriales bacterium]|nr:glycosyltransferase family 2 protein [Flavobacteriales bacterium]
MKDLSVVIITLNEERNIGRCIESVAGLAKEVVVVDSLSTDRTKEIAESLGARVVEQLFLGHIEQKNFAIEQASHEIILSLDADEALGAELKASIEEALNRFEHDGYTMNRLTNFCGKWIRHGGWYPDTKLRLFRKGQGAWTGTNPHDRYEMSLGRKAGKLNGDLLHYSFYSEEEHLAQIQKFSAISSKAKYAEGVRSNRPKILIKTAAKFIKAYVIKLGFLDGYYGWVIAKNSAFATYLRYRKLLELQSEKA